MTSYAWGHGFVVVLIVFLSIVYLWPPGDFPVGQPITISASESARGVGAQLAQQRVINGWNLRLFNFLSRVFDIDSNLKAGRYVFERPLPMWSVLWRLAEGEYGTKRRKVTIPEGSTNKQISEFVGVDVGETAQGYLFPDTYYFDQFSDAIDVRLTMLTNFDAKVGSTTHDMVILASIIEAEAASSSDRRAVAGVLLKRLKVGMPLQVDVALETYERTGLPSAPINNPGLDSIEAARNPADSSYWYYLSDKSGTIHYARTFAEHNANRRKYGI